MVTSIPVTGFRGADIKLSAGEWGGSWGFSKNSLKAKYCHTVLITREEGAVYNDVIHIQQIESGGDITAQYLKIKVT